MSAAVRLSPVPPAFRLIRKTGTSPAWNRSTGVARSRTSPVILTKAMSAAARRSSINASMLVNWENNEHPAALLDQLAPASPSDGPAWRSRRRSS